MFCRNQASACSIEFCIIGFYARKSSMAVVSTRFFFLPWDKFLPLLVLMFVETSNTDEAHCFQVQSISLWAVGNRSSESHMLHTFFLSFQEDIESAEFYEKIYITE